MRRSQPTQKPVNPGPPKAPHVSPVHKQNDLLKAAEYVRVYVLGTKAGKAYIEEFEGATGYHIRTIPAYRRYQTPIIIGAGAGRLVVVDRFGATDLIRVTDPKCGAPDSAFDSDGFPLDSFDWSSPVDLMQISIKDEIAKMENNTGLEPFIKGLTVSPRGILVATLNIGFITWDILQGHPSYSRAHKFQNEHENFIPVGHPVINDQMTMENVHLFTTGAVSPDGTSCLLMNDYLSGSPVYGIAGPDLNAISNQCQLAGASMNGEIVNFYLASDGINIDKILRNRCPQETFYQEGYDPQTIVDDVRLRLFNSYHAERLNVPGPEDIAAALSFPNTDFTSLIQNPDPNFLDMVSRNMQPITLAITEESTVGAGPGRVLPAGSTTGSLNLDRILQTEVTYPSSLPGGANQPADLTWKQIETPQSARVQKTASLLNVVAELVSLPPNPTPNDALKPLYRLIFGSHYDYLSDGGYVYGCAGPNDTVVPVNDLLEATDVAIDRSPEHGRLKELPDAKFALVDKKTGLILPEDPIKSLGFNLYAGDFAALKTVISLDTGFVRAASTPCSTLFWAQQEAADGLHRAFTDPDNNTVSSVSQVQAHVITPTVLPAAIAKLTNLVRPLDTPWSCFQPRIVAPPSLKASPALQSWSRHDNNGGYLDNWLSPTMRMNPVVEASKSSNILYPPKGSSHDTSNFTANGGGGFFFLNWQKQRVDTVDPPATNFVIPDSIQEALVGPMDSTPGQVDPLTPETVTALPTASVPSLLQRGSGVGSYPSLNRVVGFDTDIRSWIAVEIKLDRGGVFTDGVADWTQPSVPDNGLGVNVGRGTYAVAYADRLCAPTTSGTPEAADGASAGYNYDYGDKASNGAVGAWEIDVFFNGVPAKKIATRLTYLEQLQLAPTDPNSQTPTTDIRGILESTMQATGGVGTYGYHKGRAYYSPEVIKTITIKARLVNYAFDVYRIGWHTENFAHTDYFGGASFCSGNDPGFYAGNNCEAICCGNVQCLSQIFFGNKLFSSDITRPVVVNVLWEGEATYTIPDANNPYLALGNGVGYFYSVYFDFDLVNPMSAFNVNLRTGSEGRSPTGTGI